MRDAHGGIVAYRTVSPLIESVKNGFVWEKNQPPIASQFVTSRLFSPLKFLSPPHWLGYFKSLVKTFLNLKHRTDGRTDDVDGSRQVGWLGAGCLYQDFMCEVSRDAMHSGGRKT